MSWMREMILSVLLDYALTKGIKTYGGAAALG